MSLLSQQPDASRQRLLFKTLPLFYLFVRHELGYSTKRDRCQEATPLLSECRFFLEVARTGRDNFYHAQQTKIEALQKTSC
jgi:hypothetical protein